MSRLTLPPPVAFAGLTPAVGQALNTSSLGYVTANNTVLTANTLYLTPLFVPVSLTLASVSFFVATPVAASVAEVGVFAYDPSGLTATLWADLGSVATQTANAFVQVAADGGRRGPGWLALGLKPSAAITVSTASLGWGLDVSSSVPVQSLRIADGAGAFAASYSGLTLTSVAIYWRAVRAS